MFRRETANRNQDILNIHQYRKYVVPVPDLDGKGLLQYILKIFHCLGCFKQILLLQGDGITVSAHIPQF